MTLTHPAPTPAALADTDPRWWDQSLVQGWYDLLVVHGTYRLLWGCHHRTIAALYAGAVQDGMSVVEIGPGTGVHLDRLAGVHHLDLTLIDRFPGPLAVAKDRLARFKPTTHLADARGPLPLAERSADLVITSMLAHCVPGRDLHDKAELFDEAARILKPGGRHVGATVLARGVPHTPRGRAGLRYLNTRRVFHNSGDTLADLVRVLDAHYTDVRVTVRGSVALWRGTAR